jgi:phospholipase A1
MRRWPALLAALLPALGAAQPREVHECRDMAGKPGELECYREAKLPPRPREPGNITSEWHLDRGNLPAAQLTAHRPTYVIVRGTDDVNEQPRHFPAPVDFDDVEAKLQLSLRGELFSPEQLGGRLRVWYAYTQQSNWQVFNAAESRPFRDTNYEPEVILTYDSRRDQSQPAPVSWRPALVNLAIVHQSNGRSEPASRSWWRTTLQGGWQTPWGSLLGRLWHAWEESVEPDNPDITDYLGHGDLMFRSKGGWNLLVRKGFLQLDWKLPWQPLNIPFHLQLTHGYGETLLDYDHKQTTFGLGFSFWEW